MKIERLPILLFCTLSIVQLLAQPGTLDPEFGTNGIVQQSLDATNDVLTDMLLQPDGKILTAGFAWPEAAMAKFNADGTLDSNFGEGGKVYSNFGFYINAINDIILQPDGKIVAVGRTGMNYSDHDEAFIARYTVDGRLDSTFANNGFHIIDTDHYTNWGICVTLLPDGKILAATKAFSLAGFILTRLQTDGQPDENFGTNGSREVSIENYRNVTSIISQSDGKILIGGAYRDGVPNVYKFVLIRLEENGNFDESFGANGVVIGSTLVGYAGIRDILVQPDSKIVAVGSVDGTMAVVRYYPNGELDLDFGENGVVKTQIQNSNTHGSALALQSDGKIVVGGDVKNGASDYDFALARYTDDGILEAEFGIGGVTITTVTASPDQIRKLAIQNDGKIVAAGETFLRDFVVARYLAHPAVEEMDSIIAVTERSMVVYPNPIQSTSVLEYHLVNDEELSLQLFNMEGRLMWTYFENEIKSAGQHIEDFALPSGATHGIYILKLSGSDSTISIKIMQP